MGLDYESVVSWEGRPRRTRKPPPLTYWDEYVATDPWYIQELVADIPEDEMKAAIEDEDWEADSIVSEAEEDYASDSVSEGWDDDAAECAAMDDRAVESTDECSADDVECSDDDECSDDECSSSDEDNAHSSDSESAHPSGKRQRRC
jgi:hypothetical protein